MKLTTLEQLGGTVERLKNSLSANGQQTSNADLTEYLTREEASNTYLSKSEQSDPINVSIDLSEYLTKSEADDTYVAQAEMNVFCLSLFL